MSNKTEQPTPKKLRDARKKGNVPFSKDANSVATFLGGLLVISVSMRAIQRSFTEIYGDAVSRVEAEALDPMLMPAVLREAIWTAFLLLLPIVVPLALLGALAAWIQVGPVVSTEKLKPKLEKLDPLKQAKNIFSTRGLFELAKTFAKLTLLFLIAGVTIWGSRGVLLQLGYVDAAGVAFHTGSIARRFLLTVAAVFAAIGLLDFAFQRWKWRKDLMMTKDEIKREFKDSEGDPQIKGKRRQIHQEILSEDVKTAVRQADAVVVNPTHYAIVLRYNDKDMAAPKVTAKGLDKKAKMIIRMARRRNVPILRDVPLAHALYDVRVDRFVPSELFDAVAQVLLFAWKIRREGGDEFEAAR